MENTKFKKHNGHILYVLHVIEMRGCWEIWRGSDNPYTVNRQTSIMSDYGGDSGDDSTVTVKTKCVFVVGNCLLFIVYCLFICYTHKAIVAP
jgi:hypothetical protein